MTRVWLASFNCMFSLRPVSEPDSPTNRMGLLTKDSKENCLVSFVGRHLHALCFLLFCLSISGFLLIASERVCDRTYFSDNALLPGLVQREFAQQKQTDQLLEQLQSQSHGDRLPAAWLTKQFQAFGLEVYEQNFTLFYPFGRKSQFGGKNLYAILRAPRAASTEAIVLSSPYRTEQHPLGSSLPGVALMLSLSQYFATKNYWSKDIIFLVFEHELVGCQAWLNAYHDTSTSLSNEESQQKFNHQVLRAGLLQARSGQIQAAINLELNIRLSSRLDIKIEGFNGQLPNLDLFNVAVELATRESVTPTFHGRSHLFTSNHVELWIEYAQTLGTGLFSKLYRPFLVTNNFFSISSSASMMAMQATSLPTGAHGVFQKFAIQAITLQTLDKENDSAYLTITLGQLGGLIEGVVRSLNNLLERFNRSYWFYLLPSTRRYVSIGNYMIPFGLLLLPLLLRTIKIYYAEMHTKEEEAATSLWSAVGFAFACHLLGISLAAIPFLLQNLSAPQNYYKWETSDCLFYTLVCFSLFTILNPLFDWFTSQHNQRRERLVILLLNAALLLGGLSLLNISLAVILSLVYIPLLTLLPSCPSSCVNNWWNKIGERLLTRIMILFVNPLSLMFLCLLVSSVQHDQNDKPTVHLNRALQGCKRTLLYYVEDWYIYGNWMFSFGSACLFPFWLQIWNLV